MLRSAITCSAYPVDLTLIWFVACNLEAVVAAFLVIHELKPLLWSHAFEVIAQVDGMRSVTLYAFDFTAGK